VGGERFSWDLPARNESPVRRMKSDRLDEDVLAQVRDQIVQKLGQYASTYIGSLSF
jgi:hypothetical protein